MTLTEEWKTKLKEHIKEEIDDHDVYMKLADAAKKNGMHHMAGVLHDIAKDEKTHATLVMSLLDEED